jgi:hypothetical protein
MDMQHRVACKVAIDEALRDRADLAPARLDRDLGRESAGGDLRRERRRSMPPRSTLIVKQHETGALVRQG